MVRKINFIFLLFISSLIISCKSKADELREKGFHVLEEYNIAFKSPGILKFDKKQSKEFNKLYQEKYMVYRSYPDKKNEEQFYEISIKKNIPKLTDEEILRNIGSAFYENQSRRSKTEKIRINGERAIIFRYNVVTRGIQVYTKEFIYFFIIRNFTNVKKSTEKLMNSIKTLS